MTLGKLRVVTLAVSLAGIALLAAALWWIVALGTIDGREFDWHNLCWKERR